MKTKSLISILLPISVSFMASPGFAQVLVESRSCDSSIGQHVIPQVRFGNDFGFGMGLSSEKCKRSKSGSLATNGDVSLTNQGLKYAVGVTKTLNRDSYALLGINMTLLKTFSDGALGTSNASFDHSLAYVGPELSLADRDGIGIYGGAYKKVSSDDTGSNYRFAAGVKLFSAFAR